MTEQAAAPVAASAAEPELKCALVHFGGVMYDVPGCIDTEKINQCICDAANHLVQNGAATPVKEDDGKADFYDVTLEDGTLIEEKAQKMSTFFAEKNIKRVEFCALSALRSLGATALRGEHAGKTSPPSLMHGVALRVYYTD